MTRRAWFIWTSWDHIHERIPDLFFVTQWSPYCRDRCVLSRAMLLSEAATRDVLWEKVFLEILQNSQENTCARASF